LLFPVRPEFFRRACGGVFDFIRVPSNHELCIVEQLRDAFLPPLVAEHLRDPLLDRILLIAAFALDDDEWDAIHKQDEVGPPRLVETGDLEFLRDMVNVVLGVLPIDVLKLKTLPVSLNLLLKTLSKC